MIPKICLICLLAGLLFPYWDVLAQDEDEPTFDISVWQVIPLDEDGNPIEPEPDPYADPDAEILPTEVLFIALEDGATLIEARTGVDVIYTLDEGSGFYEGTELSSLDYEFAATLEILDEDTMQSTSVLITWNNFTSESWLRYERVENENYTLYTELERTILEFSLFQVCMGHPAGTPLGTFSTSTSDLLVPVQYDAKNDTLTWAGKEFNLEGEGYQHITTMPPNGMIENIITETFTPAEDGSWVFSFHVVGGGYDDCNYSSTLTPFDGDFEALFARAEALAEVTEE